MTFEIHVQDALLYIDGEPVEYDQPVELRYGVYSLTVIADGFETWERQLVIHSKEATIQIGEPELAQEDEQEDAQESADGSSVISGSAVSESTDDSETVSSEEKGTSTADATGSSTGDYSDYLDTIADLIKSLADMKDE